MMAYSRYSLLDLTWYIHNSFQILLVSLIAAIKSPTLKLNLIVKLMLNLSVLQAPDRDWVYSQWSPPVF